MSSFMGEEIRLRQVALVATDLDTVVKALETELGLSSPFHDPGVSEFGLHNAVFSLGDSFLEVVSPVRPGTTAGRYLEKRGDDGGYMAIFQVPDMADARRRVCDLGVRVVWTIATDIGSSGAGRREDLVDRRFAIREIALVDRRVGEQGEAGAS